MRRYTMKLLVFATLYTALYFCSKGAGAQNYENPKLFFEPMEFDTALRGGFNLSACFVELLTCMETIRPDVLCLDNGWFKVRYESLCSAMSDFSCSEADEFASAHDWTYKALYDSFCPPWGESFTF